MKYYKVETNDNYEIIKYNQHSDDVSLRIINELGYDLKLDGSVEQVKAHGGFIMYRDRKSKNLIFLIDVSSDINRNLKVKEIRDALIIDIGIMKRNSIINNILN